MNRGGPADRGGVATEGRWEASRGLDALGVRECVALIARADAGVAGAVAAAGDAIAGFIGAVEPGFARGGRLVYLGAGTSGRLGVLDAAECGPTFQVDAGRVVGLIAGGDGSLRRSSEGMEDDARGAEGELRGLELTGDDAVLGIAAGGTTAYVLGGLQIAKEVSGGRVVTGLLACAPVERPAWVDHLVVVETGPEVLTGSTRMKAGTATKLVLNTISTTLMVRTGRVYENLMVDLRASNEKLRDRAARIVAELTGLSRDGALELLGRAGWGVKAAVVMHRRGVGVEEAEGMLARAGGVLRRALEGRGGNETGPG